MTILAETTTGRVSTEAFEPNIYLTDGLRLFRVIRGLTWPADESLASLEDCRTLETVSFTADELWKLGLSVVPR